jgi:signal peptidase II
MLESGTVNSTPITGRNKWFIITTIFAGTILIDQITKFIAIATLKGQPTRVYFGDLARLQYSENSGAFLSLGNTLSPDTRFWLFVVAVTIGLAACFIYLFRARSVTPAQLLGLSLLTSGGFSNLLDRVLRSGGCVVDFLNVGLGQLRTGIFNIADMAIMAGVILIAWPTQNSSSGGAKTQAQSSQRMAKSR